MKWKPKITGLSIATLITTLTIALYVVPGGGIRPLQILEEKFLDWRFRIRGTEKPDNRVVILSIDDYSIESLGRWPWPRSYHADALDLLTSDGAKIIGFDLIFTDPEESPALSKIRHLRQYYRSLSISRKTPEGIKFGKILDEVAESSKYDQYLAESLGRNNNVGISYVFQSFSTPDKISPVSEVSPSEETHTSRFQKEESRELDEPPVTLDGNETLPEEEPPFDLLDRETSSGNSPPPDELYDIESRTEEPPPDEPPSELLDKAPAGGELPPLDDLLGLPPPEEPPGDILLPPEIINSSLKKISRLPNSEDSGILRAEDILLPLPEFYTTAKTLGHVNIIPDLDGSLRWSPLIIKFKDRYYPSLEVQLTREFMNVKPDDMEFIPGKGLKINDTIVPLDEKGRFLINYYGPAKTFKYYSYADLIEGTIPEGTFREKIVLVGGAATGLGDVWTTPFSQIMPGVEKHATVISNILQKNFLYRNRSLILYDILFILFTGLIPGVILPRIAPVLGTLFSIFILVLISTLNYLFFSYLKMWINLVYPALNLLLVAPAIITFRFFTVDREKRVIKGAFKQYLNPTLVEELANNPERLRLGGEKKELTVLFSDIRGFTTFSEKNTPEEVVQILNEYLDAMTEVVFRWGGTLDKYIGDAIIAFWGAPLKVENHAELAVKCALHMMERLKGLQKKWIAEGREPLDIGIGINTGEMLVGNIGSEGRKMDYTVIGDHVNLGARLEALTRKYGNHIIVSEFTVEKIKGTLEKGTLGHVIFRGLEKVAVKGKKKPVAIYDLAVLEAGTPSSLIRPEGDMIVKMKEK
jgi:adenylate cyclase